MRNRILAGLGVAALATVGLATPATALSSTTADIWVVHAFPGVEVDVYINGDLALDSFMPGDVEPLVNVAAGNYVVDIVASVDPAAPTITEGTGLFGTGAAGADIAAGTSYSLVAHPLVGGAPTLAAFVNDLTPAGPGQASVTVRHTADAPAVDVVALPNTPLFSGVTNGQQGKTTVAAATYDLQVQLDGSDPQAVAIDLPNTTLAAGTHYFIHAFGPDVEDAFSVVIFTIADTPSGVPAGSAGLVAENGSSTTALIAGGVALLALLAVAGVVVARRQGATAGR